jgi:hypothetical protein
MSIFMEIKRIDNDGNGSSDGLDLVYMKGRFLDRFDLLHYSLKLVMTSQHLSFL